MDIIEVLKELNVLNQDELDYIQGILLSEPAPKTAKQLASIVREAQKYVKNQKKT
jgi:EAL domain-containing protein (putative c-di-GMP-specific phosphodiesterase class I)